MLFFIFDALMDFKFISKYILLTRLCFFCDLGFPYEVALGIGIILQHDWSAYVFLPWLISLCVLIFQTKTSMEHQVNIFIGWIFHVFLWKWMYAFPSHLIIYNLLWLFCRWIDPLKAWFWRTTLVCSNSIFHE